MEFNLGICFFTCTQIHPETSTQFTYIAKYLYVLVGCTFLSIWWAQLGSPVVSYYETCIRMYYFSPCIQVHHGFLMRGCFLGITLISNIILSNKQNFMLDATHEQQEISCYTFSSKNGILLTNSMSAVVFIWPMCYVVQILLEVNFSESLVHENAAMLVLIVPCITWGVGFAWQWSRWQAPERGGLRLPRQAEAGGNSHRHPVSCPRGCRALPPHFPRCSLGAFRLFPVRSEARFPSLPQLWVP